MIVTPIITSPGRYSPVNSTTTPLGSGATFTAAGELSSLPDVMVSCQTDNTGTLYFDFSNDGSNWSTFPVSGFKVFTDIHVFHKALKGPRYFRVRLLNDTGAQSYLRLYTYFGFFGLPNAPINQNVNEDADAIIVRSVDTRVDLAFGRFNGMLEDSKFGSVMGVDTADSARDIWALADDGLTGGSLTKTFPTSANTLYLASTDNSDTMVATVNYLDANGAPQEANITLTGNTGATIGTTALDCNRIVIGPDQPANAGGVYISTANSFTSGIPDDLTTALAYIPAGLKQTQQALDQVPVGYRYRLKKIIVFCSRASGAAGSALIYLQIKTTGDWITKRIYPITTASPFVAEVAGLVFDGGTKIRAYLVSVSDNDTNITVEWQFDMIKI